MDALELLKKDHQKVTELFQRFHGGAGLSGIMNRVTGSVSERQRRTAAEQVCRELDVHAMIEEEVFYPAVRQLGDEKLNDMLQEAYKEHGTVKQQVAQIRRGIGKDPDLQAKMTELQRNVDHHVREEENEMFPRIEELMDERRRAEFGRELQARKRAAMGTVAATTRRAAGTRGRSRGRAAAARTRSRRKTATTARSRQRKTTARARTRRTTQTKSRKRSSTGGRRRSR